jgi:hypothetical protein
MGIGSWGLLKTPTSHNATAVFVSHPKVLASGKCYFVTITSDIPVKLPPRLLEAILWKNAGWRCRRAISVENLSAVAAVKRGFIVLVHFNQDEWLCGEKQSCSFSWTCCYVISQQPDYRALTGQNTTATYPEISFLVSWRKLRTASSSLFIVPSNRNLLYRQLLFKTSKRRIVASHTLQTIQ